MFSFSGYLWPHAVRCLS